MLKCSNVIICESNDAVLTKKKLSIILKHTKLTHGIDLSCRTTDGVSYKKILKLAFFYASYATWLTVEHLINLKCKMAFFDEHNLTEEDLTRFFKHYVAGRLPNLQRLRIGKLKNGPVWENLLKDVKYTKWDEKKRSRYYITYSAYTIWENDCKDAWDFECNGKLVSVMQDSEYFQFFVWKNRFPRRQ